MTESLEDLKARLIILHAARLRLAAEVEDMTNENKDPMSDQDAIARRAHELFVERGGEPGHHEEDWLRAEEELRSQAAGQNPGDANESSKPGA